MEVINPNELAVTVFPGLPKFGWLKMSKNSDRNCRLTFSVIYVFLTMEKSVFTKSGPCNASRCISPGVQEPGMTG